MMSTDQKVLLVIESEEDNGKGSWLNNRWVHVSSFYFIFIFLIYQIHR